MMPVCTRCSRRDFAAISKARAVRPGQTPPVTGMPQKWPGSDIHPTPPVTTSVRMGVASDNADKGHIS